MLNRVIDLGVTYIEFDKIKEFTYYYFLDDGQLRMDKPIPKEAGERWESIPGAYRYFASIGCWQGTVQKPFKDVEYYWACLNILRFGVKYLGTIYPVLYRGVQSIQSHGYEKIIFGTPDKAVAQWYAGDKGKVIEYYNVKALMFNSLKIPVLGGDELDKEAVFFHDI